MAKTAVLKPFLAIATDKMKAKTVAELQARTEFKEGDVVEVLGELVAGDGKHHMRIASKVADASGVQGQNGLFWNVVPNSLINLIAQAVEQNKSDILSRVPLYESLPFKGISYNANGNLYWGTSSENYVFFTGNNCVVTDYFMRIGKFIIARGRVNFTYVGSAEASETIVFPIAFSDPTSYTFTCSVSNTRDVPATFFNCVSIPVNAVNGAIYVRNISSQSISPLVVVDWLAIGY